jgi:hypothetical protein
MKRSNNTVLPKTNLFISVIILIALIFLNFYGLYSNQFHFNKPGSFIFPLVTLAHFVYIYVLWFKISEDEYPDVVMKSIEYIMYGVLLVYFYEIVETFLLLSSQEKFHDYVIPSTFMPMGILIISLQSLLVLFTLWSFLIRKRRVGKYDIDYLNDHLSSWQRTS